MKGDSMTNPNIHTSREDEDIVTVPVTISGRGDFSPGWDERVDIDGHPVDDRVPGDDTAAVQSMAKYIQNIQKEHPQE